MARGHDANDYGRPAYRSNRMHRPAILANHAIHWASSLIVMSIAAYFIAKFSRDAHLVYWICVAAIDAFLYLPALFLPAVKSYKGYLAPVAWVFSYLWLTAFIFAAQDYNYGNCVANSPSFVNKCALKKTLEAFAFIAFFTNLIGTILEGRLWDLQRFKGSHTSAVDKHNTVGAGTQSATTATV